jgi:hypothetical protein
MQLPTSLSVPHNFLLGAPFLQSQEQHLSFSGFDQSLADLLKDGHRTAVYYLPPFCTREPFSIGLHCPT